MLLADLAATSEKVAGTSKRTEKLAHLAAAIRQIPRHEVDAGVRYLAGQLRQKKLGVGWAGLQNAVDVAPAAEPTLSIEDVDRALAEIAVSAGAGSIKKKSAILGGLFQRSTALEQNFLRRLLGGGLRQGALESLVIDAIAKAA